MMRLYSNDARVRMSLQLAAPPGTRVYCDRSQLMRVLTNLMENAYQSLPEEGDARITLGVQKEADTVVLWVADTGSGIPEEVRSKIFQPYFTTRSSGTGLGLAMTRKIIEFWKGTIWFETEVQKGTTFFVRLPVASA